MPISRIAFTALLIAFFASHCLRADDSPTSRLKTLFAFDDHSIPWKSNLKLTLVPPKKHADNPVLPRGGKGSADELGVQFYGSVLRHDGKYKMWYIAMDDSALKVSRMGLLGMAPAYAESEDGVHWHKPKLGLVEHHGSKQNNLVHMGTVGACGIHLIVIHEPDDPDPERRFKMMLTSLTRLQLKDRKQTVSTSVAFFSRDGLRWHPAKRLRYKDGHFNSEDQFLPNIHFEQSGLFRWKGMYHLVGQQVSPWIWQPDGKKVGRVISLFRSPDLIHWEKSSALGFIRGTAVGVVGKPALDEEAHLASVWDRGNVLLGVHGLWHGAQEWQDRTIDLGLMLSNDGIHFREPIRDHVLIRRGDTGDWDEGGLLQGQGFLNVGDQTYLYYGSWDLTKAPAFPPRGGVGLVALRRDGFGYLSHYNNDTPAEFVTSHFHAGGDKTKVFINVDQVSRDYPIVVELLNERSQPIANYSGGQAGKVETSGIRQDIVWPATGSSVVEVEGSFAVRVKFRRNSNARVYAIYVSE